jgi:hypothetical protein
VIAVYLAASRAGVATKFTVLFSCLYVALSYLIQILLLYPLYP